MYHVRIRSVGRNLTWAEVSSLVCGPNGLVFGWAFGSSNVFVNTSNHVTFNQLIASHKFINSYT